MAVEFGKLNFAVGFNRTSAFPLDANSYFEDYNEAVAAAAGAAVVGSADSAYYIGQLLIVKDSTVGVGLYQINAGKTLTKFGQASSAEELAERVSALETRCTNIEGKLILATSDKEGLMSKEDFAKLAGIESGAQKNIIEGVQVDGTDLEVTGKKVNIDLSSYAKKSALEGVQTTAEAAMPKAGGEFTGAIKVIAPTEDTNPATKKYVDDALGSITGVKFEVVESLPTTGEAGTIYLIAHAHGEKDIYDEYIWVTDKFEKIGSTDIDLSSYATDEELTAAINGLTLTQVDLTAGKTLKSIKQEQGKVTVELQDIAVEQSQVNGLAEALAGKQAASENLNKFNALEGAGLVKKTAEGYEVDTNTYLTDAALVDYAKKTEVAGDIAGLKTELEGQIALKQNAINAENKLDGALISGSVARATTADKVANVLTAGTKTYNGSEAIEITAADLGALTEVPAATAEALGAIKVGYTSDATHRAVELDVNNQAFVTIPEAISYTAGAGLAKEGNEFKIAEGGILTSMIGENQVTDTKIQSLNVTKLTQEEGDTLILDGGTSN